MKKLNLNKPLLDETGKEVMKPLTLASSLGNTMLKSEQTTEVDILKLYTWALTLGKTGILELDEADAKALKTFVIEDPTLYIIVKAPILKEIDKLKF